MINPEDLDPIIYQRTLDGITIKLDHIGQVAFEMSKATLSINEDCEDLIFLIRRAQAYWGKLKK